MRDWLQDITERINTAQSSGDWASQDDSRARVKAAVAAIGATCYSDDVIDLAACLIEEVERLKSKKGAT